MDLDGDGWARGAREAAALRRGDGYVRCRPPIQVLVEHGEQLWPGFAVAYSGERVTVQFSVGVGSKHLMVVPAAAVIRRCGLTLELPWRVPPAG